MTMIDLPEREKCGYWFWGMWIEDEEIWERAQEAVLEQIEEDD